MLTIQLETIKRRIRINHATICLLRLIYFRDSVIDKSLTLRDHRAAVTSALVFQKWLNDLLLQQLYQLKLTTDKSKLAKLYKDLKLHLCYKTLYRTKYTARQGGSQGGHVAIVATWRHFMNIFLDSWAKRGLRVFDQGRTQGGGVKNPSWAWYFIKLLITQRRLIVFAYFLLVNLST